MDLYLRSKVVSQLKRLGLAFLGKRGVCLVADCEVRDVGLVECVIEALSMPDEQHLHLFNKLIGTQLSRMPMVLRVSSGYRIVLSSFIENILLRVIVSDIRHGMW